MIYKKLALLLLTIQLAACATKPAFDTSQVNRMLSPQSVLAQPTTSGGELVVWGGTILDIQNLAEVTQIELLAYPLNSSDRPNKEQSPLGRFLVRHKGFLEPTSYSQGRALTVLGSVGGQQKGAVGESTYVYPVIVAQELHLWSKERLLDRTNFHFGIGVGL